MTNTVPSLRYDLLHAGPVRGEETEFTDIPSGGANKKEMFVTVHGFREGCEAVPGK